MRQISYFNWFKALCAMAQNRFRGTSMLPLGYHVDQMIFLSCFAFHTNVKAFIRTSFGGRKSSRQTFGVWTDRRVALQEIKQVSVSLAYPDGNLKKRFIKALLAVPT